MLEETGEAIDARARVVARARSFLGPNGEPKAQDPDQFFEIAAPQFSRRVSKRDNTKTTAWCGIFALSCLILEGITNLRWETGKGFVGHLRVVSLPAPGDVVVFGAPLWHHAIVERVEAGKVHTIDGNVLGPIEGCAARVRDITPATTFYSIHSLIADAGA